MKIKPQKELRSDDRITAEDPARGRGSDRKEDATGDRPAPGGMAGAAPFFDFFRAAKIRLSPATRPADLIKLGLGLALLSVLMGCVGYVGGRYRGRVLVPGPEVYIFGGYYERGREVRDYSHRGYESRVLVHPVLGRPGIRR